MLKLDDCKAIFAAIGLIVVLLLASPTLGLILHLPEAEQFSELWILGPENMAENYPFNTHPSNSYVVHIGVGNHIGSSAYYVIYLKLGNRTDALPNSTAGIPSPLSPAYEQHIFVQSGENWTTPLVFAFYNVTSVDNRLKVGNLIANGDVFNVEKTALWDAENDGYYYQLFVELWIYNPETDAIRFDNRYVGLWLNMTVA